MSTSMWDNIYEVLKAIEDAEDNWQEADDGLCGCAEDEEADFEDARLCAEAELDDLRIELEDLVSEAEEAGVEFNDDQNGRIAWALGQG